MNAETCAALFALTDGIGIPEQALIALLDHGINLSSFVAQPDAYRHIYPFPPVQRSLLQQHYERLLRQPPPAWDWARSSSHHHLVLYNSPAYPFLLTRIARPPLLLYVAGQPAALATPQLAVVGSRRHTSYGDCNTRLLTQALCTRGYAVTSGLACGIDSIAHWQVIYNNGITIGVLGSGIDVIYPAANIHLAERMTGHGAIVSEFPLGTPPMRSNFPRRNRLISGLSLGTLIVEATLKSGSLITARYALEQGREVFAIPGNIYHNSCSGCHSLLKQGAKLVSSIEDILEELPSDPFLLCRGPSAER